MPHLREHRAIRGIRRNNEWPVNQHDVFLSEVQESGFEALVERFRTAFLNVTEIIVTA